MTVGPEAEKSNFSGPWLPRTLVAQCTVPWAAYARKDVNPGCANGETDNGKKHHAGFDHN
jgi:hypothetical protein